MDVFNFVAGLASIAGFVLTIWTLREVRSLKAQRVQLVALPKSLTRLAEVEQDVRGALNLPEHDGPRAQEALMRATTILQQVEQKLSGEDRLIVTRYRQAIQRVAEQANPSRDLLYQGRAGLAQAY